ncbi:MAG: tRNA (adenosine(37)-N6)-threonylcarbamoyltransferase complex transferase subunit TsaD [Lachnospiraceae bacterium]|nr:tRNA (adenosine(37)-N6)-threonylcarbamoyltransferase complex transferase subunit TsaD [Lachnospiraceae bacterium]
MIDSMNQGKKDKTDVCILGIETSCDETAAAVVINGREVKSNVIASQIDIHTKFGGVVPEIASRKHVEAVTPVVAQALQEAGMRLAEVDAIAVTYGPGLVGALLVGVSFAKSLAFATGKPLIGVHHIEGHICSNYIQYPELTPPFVCLVASGGHSHLTLVKDYGVYDILGQTRDDAAGEAFDKVARVLGLGYPGGPAIDRAAKEGNPEAFDFPRAKIPDAPYDFSFSGLKSTVLNLVNRYRMKQGDDQTKDGLPVHDIAASFRKAVVDVLLQHTMEAVRDTGVKKVAIAGGVASNALLRESLEAACKAEGCAFFRPAPVLCTDNAAMIAGAAYYEMQRGISHDMSLNAKPNLPLGDRERRFHGVHMRRPVVS